MCVIQEDDYDLRLRCTLDGGKNCQSILQRCRHFDSELQRRRGILGTDYNLHKLRHNVNVDARSSVSFPLRWGQGMSATLQLVKTGLVLLDLNNDVLQRLVVEVLLLHKILPFLIGVYNLLLLQMKVLSPKLRHELVHDDPHSLPGLAPVLESYSLTLLLTGKLVALNADLICEHSINKLHHVAVA